MYCFVICVCILSVLSVQGQNEKYDIGGYLHYNQSVLMEQQWQVHNQFHNRINTEWHIDTALTAGVELRNRFFYGDIARQQPELIDMLDAQVGYIDMSTAYGDGNSWVASSVVDRLYLDYTYKKMQIILGRQRINWGRNIVWNPHDVFNTASYFDVDYVEKSGSDAVRMMYYTNETAHAEWAVKKNADSSITAGALYKWNTHGYDVQCVAGVFEDDELFAGIGWEGYVHSFSVRGEMNMFYPHSYTRDTTPTVLFGLGTDYMTSSGIFLQAECLYNQYAEVYNLESLLMQNPSVLVGGGTAGTVQQVKSISFDEFSAFVSAQYSINPLCTVGLSGMYFMESQGFFLNPSVSYSLAENFEISCIGQYFNFTIRNAREDYTIAYGLLSWSF
ncbi:MAG: hypothetical protein R6U95_02760 [Bacteroidales bacterium]